MTTLSVCIPTKNRHAELARSMATVMPMARRAGAEVLICDQSPRPFAHPDTHVLHRPDLPGLPAARNALLHAAHGDVILFIDDDTDTDSRLGIEILRLARTEPGISAWGPVMERRLRAARLLHRLLHLGCMRDVRRLTTGPADLSTRELFGCCFAVRRTDALAVGGCDARLPGYALGEDRDLCWRLAASGRRLRFASGLIAHHRAVGGQSPPLRARLGYLLWFASRHGRGEAATLAHLLLTATAWCVAAMARDRLRPTIP